jgi:hypothetical protein
MGRDARRSLGREPVLLQSISLPLRRAWGRVPSFFPNSAAELPGRMPPWPMASSGIPRMFTRRLGRA